MNKKIEEIKSFIEEELTDREKVELHNRYCAETNNLDSYIYNMGEFDEIIIPITVLRYYHSKRDFLGKAVIKFSHGLRLFALFLMKIVLSR